MNAEIFTNADRDSLIQMFVDGTNGETYGKGRLLTREVGESRTELIAYGWNKIAEYDSETEVVTLFAGHSGDVSPTVTRYVNLVREIAGKRRSRKVNVIDTSPNLQGNVPAESAQFIQNYRNFDNNPSPIEEWATQTVERAVGNAARALL